MDADYVGSCVMKYVHIYSLTWGMKPQEGQTDLQAPS